ncbi:MAG: endonuclease III [Dehalococcoidia bacterium]|nr:endonuclease III [Dehalococcoidia bacterium]
MVIASNKPSLKEIMDTLDREYGQRTWSPRNDPLSELVQTVLSQHTSDTNAERAFKGLMGKFVTWDAVARGGVDEIEESIRSGGLAKQKAPRIQAILNRLNDEGKGSDMSFLEEMSVEEALEWLTSIPGIGPKTARCVLLFSLGLPVIPVDTHVHRVARRLGLIGAKTTADQAHGVLEALVPKEDAYRFHMHLIDHGRKTCKAPRPRCNVCPLSFACPSSEAGP